MAPRRGQALAGCIRLNPVFVFGPGGQIRKRCLFVLDPDFLVVTTEFRTSTAGRSALSQNDCIRGDQSCKDASEKCDSTNFQAQRMFPVCHDVTWIVGNSCVVIRFMMYQQECQLPCGKDALHRDLSGNCQAFGLALLANMEQVREKSSQNRASRIISPPWREARSAAAS